MHSVINPGTLKAVILAPNSEASSAKFEGNLNFSGEKFVKIQYCDC